MRGEELFINGQPCDLDANSSITLKIVSNLFGDVAKIASNSTYTISLPRTTRNQAIFGLAEYPTSDNGAQGTKMTCDYYRSGCKMINKGVAVLTGASDKSYTISVMYGVGDKLIDISERGVTIQALDNTLKTTMKASYHPADPTLLSTDELTHYSGKNSNVVIAEYNPFTYTKPALAGSYWADMEYWNVQRYDAIDYGWRAWADAGDHVLPCVNVWNILQKYTSQGVSVSFADNSRRDLTKDMAIPLATKNANEQTTGISYEHRINRHLPFFHYEGDTIEEFNINANQQDYLFTRVLYEGTQDIYYLKANVGMNAYIYFEGSATLITPKTTNINCEADIFVRVADTYHQCKCFMYGWKIESSRNVYELRFKGEGLIKIEQGDNVKVVIRAKGTNFSSIAATGGITFANTTIVNGEVPDGMKLPIYYNLPPITMLDLLKAVAFYTGTYPRNINGGNTITLENISTIFSRKNTANSVDWSSKIVEMQDVSAPDSTAFTFDSWARRNWYKMKDNELASDGYNGSIDINNETLAKERDVYTLPFVAGDFRHYPVYEKKTITEEGVTTTEYTFKEGKPAIFEIVKNAYSGSDPNYEYCGLNFGEKVMPSAVLEKYYKEMKRVLNDARVVTASVNLTDIDIAQFDETKPVYLAQYGRYYAVLEISTTYGKYASVKLLQI